MKSGKVWGITELLESNSALEFHRIAVEAGGVCSRHCHRHRYNGFFVETGRLLLRVWKNDYDLVDETVLLAGDYARVAPGEYHQFEALEPTVAFEIYWVEMPQNDIQRDTAGFKRSEISQ